MELTRTLDDFTPDNDPHEEHDFGSFEIDDQKFIFKHDYYDKSMQYGDPKKQNASSQSCLRTNSEDAVFLWGLVVHLSGIVAELGAAFLCADLRITDVPGTDHAQYLASWLAVLKADKKAIFAAASTARPPRSWRLSRAPKLLSVWPSVK